MPTHTKKEFSWKPLCECVFCSRWLISGPCVPRGHVTGLLHYFLCCCVTLAFCFSNRVVSVEEWVVGRSVSLWRNQNSTNLCGWTQPPRAVCVCVCAPCCCSIVKHLVTNGLSYNSTAETSSDFSQTVFQYCTNQVFHFQDHSQIFQSTFICIYFIKSSI